MSGALGRVPGLLLPAPALPWRLAAAGYVLVDATLGAIAFSSDQARPPVEIAAFLLALPAVVVDDPGDLRARGRGLEPQRRDARPADVAGDADVHRPLRRHGPPERDGRVAGLVLLPT